MLLSPGKRLAAAGLLIASLSLPAHAEPKLIDKRESKYSTIFVFRDGDYLSMSFGLNDRLYVESKANAQDPLELPAIYSRYMAMPFVYQKKTGTLLEIGLGGGTVTTYLSRTFPDLKIDAVEIDPVVVEMAEEYFFVKPGPLMRVTSRDGRIFLMRSKDSYDVILVDAYRGPDIPFHLMTKEFFQLAKRRLNKGGVIGYNLHYGTQLYEAELATIATVFDNVDVYKALENYVIVAYDGPKLSDEALAERASEIDRTIKPRYSLTKLVADREHAEDLGGQVLTDDFAPVDSLQATERTEGPNG